MEFEKAYFDQIWGDVHRHDYCEGLADTLIAKYGKVRFLDIGTGCGELVRVLRERGCEAWGLEISQYAMDNNHGFVRQGDVRNIPFAADSFDVVFSQGLWSYIPEEDIAAAWKECNRVGKLQEHNIDYEDAPAELEFATRKPVQWWKDKFYPKVLVACPTHEMKEYAFAEWLECVQNLSYPNYDIFVVDNSPTTDFYERWKDKVPMVHITGVGNNLQDDICQRIAASMEVIREKFLAGNYYKWFNLESDVLCPTNAIELMIDWGRDTDWIAHQYPARGGDQDLSVQSGIGCTLLSRKIMENYSFANCSVGKCPDAWLWDMIRPLGTYTSMEMWSFMKTKHLGTGEGSQ